MANEKNWDCNLCIHMNVCPAYEVTQTECQHYLPMGNVLPVVRCKDCKHEETCVKQLVFWERDKVLEQNVYKYHDLDFCSFGERKTK